MGASSFSDKKSVEFRVVAGCNDQRVDGPFIAVDFDGAVLNDAEVNLDQIFLVFIDLVGEVDPAAGHPGKGAPAKVEPIRVVGVGDMHEPLDGFFSKQVDCRRGDFILGGILPGNRSQALGKGYRNDIDEAEHLHPDSPSVTVWPGCRSTCSRSRPPGDGKLSYNCVNGALV
jgi:hypothetical protein